MIKKTIARKFNDARDFLEDHPAMASPVYGLQSLLSFSLQEVCKRGYCEQAKKDITIFYTPGNYKRFKELFDKKLKEDPAFPKGLISIHVPYKTYFKEPWGFDHVEYWGEIAFAMFKGPDVKKWDHCRTWERYQGFSVSGLSFEEMIINIAKDVRKNLGDWSSEDFLTGREKKNHEKHLPLIEKEKIEQGTIMQQNPKYIDVTPAQLNLRWVKWFEKSPYGQKHWKDELKAILKNRRKV